MNIERCYEARDSNSPAVLFYPGGIESECWSMSQFLRCRVEANPPSIEKRNAPPEILTAIFAMGRVIITGRGLDKIAQKLRSNELTKVELSRIPTDEVVEVDVNSIRFELDE